MVKIGQPFPRYDARPKVTGQEKYAADYYGRDFLWAGAKRAGVAHARLKRVDAAHARQLPGVVAVLTSLDVPGSNRQGIIRKDQPVLVDEKIRHAGDAVALVIADDRETLRQAIDLITLDVEPLPGVFDWETALSPEAPLVHEDHSTGNLLRQVVVKKGKGEEGLNECALVVEGSFEVSRQEHAFLETQAGWAFTDDDGTIVIVASTQTPFRDRLELTRTFDLDVDRIRVIAPYLGGAFGGKDGITVQALLTLAVLHSEGKPVKMWWDREESFLAGVKRLPGLMDYRLGADANGAIKALSCRLYFDSGAYATLSGEIMTLGAEHAGGAYNVPDTYIEGNCIYTNNPVSGPFRGFGVPQVTAAIEQVVDELAARLEMDPLEFRIRNALKPGDENCIGVRMSHSTSVRECLLQLKDHPYWKGRSEWKRSAGAFKRRGVGLACLSHAMGYPKIVPDRAGAKIELTSEGTFRVYAGISDMGQGNASTYLQITGEVLGQDEAHLEVLLPDTAATLPSGSASASRCTYVYGNALVEAAGQLRERILARGSVLLDVPSSGLSLEPGCICHEKTGRRLPLADISIALGDERFVEHYYTAPVARESSDIIYMGPHVLFSYGAHLARIEVDELTGGVEVKDYLAVTDAGRILNPQTFEQQVQGGIAQGLGYALTEEFVVKDGIIGTAGLATYTIPTALDVPDMISLTVDAFEESGPFGMKGAGEIGINGPLPAVANGVADALGVRAGSAPLTAERLYFAIHGEKTE
jgi:CO/xanthine dehydrogenase Mo-binding subunit